MRNFTNTFASVIFSIAAITFLTFAMPTESPDFILKVSQLLTSLVSMGCFGLIAFSFVNDLFNLAKSKF